MKRSREVENLRPKDIHNPDAPWRMPNMPDQLDDDEVLAQVMDEIGLDVASQMSSAPRGGGQSGAVTSTVGEVTGTAGEAPSVQAM